MYTTRPGAPTDLNFIFASWMKGLRYGNADLEKIPPQIYDKKQRLVIAELLGRATVLVYCLTEDQDVILGYIVYEGEPNAETLHWVFVKKDWRRQGIAHHLIPPHAATYTQITKNGLEFLQKHYPQMHYNPAGVIYG